MTIANGHVITASDLGTLVSTQLGLMRTDNNQAPLGHHQSFWFHGLSSATTPERRKCIFVVPWDCLVESLVAHAGEYTAASTLTVELTGDGALPSFPIAITSAVGAGRTKLARVLFDGSLGYAGDAYMASNPALRVLPRGSTVTLSVSTTSAATGSALEVVLALRSWWGRT